MPAATEASSATCFAATSLSRAARSVLRCARVAAKARGMNATDPQLLAAAQVSKAWPFEEARKLVKRMPQGKALQNGSIGPVLFETGYGPSGCRTSGRFRKCCAPRWCGGRMKR